ncbi:MAG: hypothetical protein UDB11_02790 [Peptococcaceae bacterium]|nr:hypothetical protein [Peptococcaceae bacterium]
MTEKQFDQLIENAVENAADRFERCVEAGADHLDRRLNHFLNHFWWISPCFRRSVRVLNIGSGVAMLALAKHLYDEGSETAAHCCAALGGGALLWELGRLVFLRRG